MRSNHGLKMMDSNNVYLWPQLFYERNNYSISCHFKKYGLFGCITVLQIALVRQMVICSTEEIGQDPHQVHTFCLIFPLNQYQQSVWWWWFGSKRQQCQELNVLVILMMPACRLTWITNQALDKILHQNELTNYN